MHTNNTWQEPTAEFAVHQAPEHTNAMSPKSALDNASETHRLSASRLKQSWTLSLKDGNANQEWGVQPEVNMSIVVRIPLLPRICQLTFHCALLHAGYYGDVVHHLLNLQLSVAATVQQHEGFLWILVWRWKLFC
eukprot:84832-Prorocentrum_minimum.AAC.4